MSSTEASQRGGWKLGSLFSRQSSERRDGPSRWSMGVLNDKTTIEVPGSVLLLASDRNEPLGLRNVHARTSHSSIPAGFPVETPLTPSRRRSTEAAPPISSSSHGVFEEPEETKKTEDGKIILEPQPDDSVNDPLNWPTWRRDAALLSLGFYCMVGGGITPLVAAGFTNIAKDFNVSVEHVSLTTGLYMMGMGVGSVFASPTAILFGKRPIYLVGSIILIGTSLWAGYSPSFKSLLAARVFQGVAVSPVECLPSATIAEIFFLHERAYRIGIYTLLLLGGKNLVPLVSAAIIGRFGWRWVFWVVAMVMGLGFILLFAFVPETFWDRTPTRRHSRKPSRRPSFLRRLSSRHGNHGDTPAVIATPARMTDRPASPGAADRQHDLHVGFSTADQKFGSTSGGFSGDFKESSLEQNPQHLVKHHQVGFADPSSDSDKENAEGSVAEEAQEKEHLPKSESKAKDQVSTRPESESNSKSNADYFSLKAADFDNEKIPASKLLAPPKIHAYTHNLRHQPRQSFVQQLKPIHGRLNHDSWFKVAIRPFILFSYPAVLWSTVIYSCSIGWLIVVSETLAIIYRNPDTYNFTALQTGLVYVSPFLGGILGTGVAGKVSDLIVRAMATRNGGLYEPEFRLVMAIPILIATCAGLIGFGWSVQERDSWIVPTIFFGIISFGCALGSTTSITFCVDSYRQYAGEALVTLNFSKNIFHGLVFSLFVSNWLHADGSKQVFMWLGIVQLIFCLFSLPMYIYGKRLRMWTTRLNLMEKF